MKLLFPAEVEQTWKAELRTRLQLEAKDLPVEPECLLLIVDYESYVVDPQKFQFAPRVLPKLPSWESVLAYRI